MKINSLAKCLCLFTLSTNAKTQNEADTLQIIQLCEKGVEHNKHGEYKAAQLTYNDAISKVKDLGDDKECYLALCYELYGDNYYFWRVWGPESSLNYADAKKYYVEAARIWASAKGENCPEVTRLSNKIGACWFRLENNENAAIWFNKALATKKNIIDGNPKHLALTYANLTFAYLDIVKYFYSVNDYNNTKCYLEELVALEKLINGNTTEKYRLLQHQLDLLEKENHPQ